MIKILADKKDFNYGNIFYLKLENLEHVLSIGNNTRNNGEIELNRYLFSIENLYEVDMKFVNEKIDSLIEEAEIKKDELKNKIIDTSIIEFDRQKEAKGINKGIILRILEFVKDNNLESIQLNDGIFSDSESFEKAMENFDMIQLDSFIKQIKNYINAYNSLQNTEKQEARRKNGIVKYEIKKIDTFISDLEKQRKFISEILEEESK